jgi:hypothetical protein
LCDVGEGFHIVRLERADDGERGGDRAFDHEFLAVVAVEFLRGARKRGVVEDQDATAPAELFGKIVIGLAREAHGVGGCHHDIARREHGGLRLFA